MTTAPSQSPRVVGIQYTLKDAEGQIMDSSEGEPLFYLEGAHNIIPGLEAALATLNPGDKTQVVVPPEEAYGTYHDDLRFTMQLSQFDNHVPEVGQVLEIGDEETVVQATVVSIEADLVNLDANHPMAGKTLHFEVEVVSSRAPNPEELSHGHPHEGHHHHH